MFAKAIDILTRAMSKEELVKLHEEWNCDVYNSFFHEYEEKLNEIAPEEFINL